MTIVKPDGKVAKTPHEAGDALKEHWARVVSEQPASLAKGKEILDKFGEKLDLPTLAMPGRTDIERVLRGAHHSMLGPGGLYYSCWQGAGAAASRVLYRVLVEIASGVTALAGFQLVSWYLSA